MLVVLWHFHHTRSLSAFAKRIPIPFCLFAKLYFVFDFIPFFRFLTLSFRSFVQKFLEKGQGNPVRNVGTKKTRVLVLRESRWTLVLSSVRMAVISC